ncbi:hypothetical protein JD844_021313 [Phrynosoma platyrhinos]|uniref:PLA2c domain-containing protein n=1 Tax=Phrynosoma platyrhinos TaxID=52577 RepID=A0ABQ7STG4_PHRPL|nr:hypothetical protein JD844_021313 [Phrynosoma platyrhinos]
MIPIVAVMTTAGGFRSMTAMYGSLLGLQKLNLLDCISYVTGLSGTTWTMINLYGDANWTKRNLEETISDVRKHVMKNKLCCFSGEKLKYYEKEMCQRYQEGHKVSFSDLWGLLLESMLTDEPDPQKLSDQQQAINMGQNPFPIYLGLNVRKRYSTLDFKAMSQVMLLEEWMECTPYEVGFLKYGAFIKAEDFGSEFFMGRMMKKIPESRLSYLQDEDIPPIVPKRRYVQPTNLYVPSGTLTNVLRDVITLRPVLAHYYNFMKGLHLNNKYLENDSFRTWKDTVLDSVPNQLTDTEEYLELVDTACFINTSCPPLLRPERKVDVILHLNYSGGSQLLPLDLSTKYYAEQGIPFPKVVLTEEDREHLKECYVFDEVENPKAPILVYMPLVCDTFQNYKAPGVERSPSEIEEGQANVTSTIFSPYATGMIQYSEANFNKLVNLTNYNILNNEHMILQALRTAVDRKKHQKSLFTSS